MVQFINAKTIMIFVCLFDLTLYVPVNNLSVMSGRVFLGARIKAIMIMIKYKYEFFKKGLPSFSTELY